VRGGDGDHLAHGVHVRSMAADDGEQDRRSVRRAPGTLDQEPATVRRGAHPVGQGSAAPHTVFSSSAIQTYSATDATKTRAVSCMITGGSGHVRRANATVAHTALLAVADRTNYEDRR